MQLHKIKAYIEAYKNYLQSPQAYQLVHYWESQAHWQSNWDAEAKDWRLMYDGCLQNSVTKRLWKREAYEPKHMMMAFIELDQYFVQSMFDDLFDENKDVHSRADRFVFYCDQLMMQYRAKYPMRVDTGHYHDDNYEMISLYLSFQYPDLYAPYQAERFLTLLKRIGAANIPPAGDFPRHVKVMRTLHNFLLKDEMLLELHQARLSPQHYADNSLLLCFDFVCFICQ